MSALWKANLPSDKDYSKKSDVFSVSVGDYFTAADLFLSRDDFFVVKSAIKKSEKIQANLQTSDIEKIEIYLVKHGQFYHPARISVTFFQKTIFFVLNLAVSDEGIACMEREYPLLEKLSHKIADIPAVYEKGDVAIRDNLVFSMFLAKWFGGYNEFHTSYDNGVQKVIVWDYEKGFYYLSDKEIYSLYKKASTIMANCYNVETCEQIQPWHHAAGDFVVKNDEDGIHVKLITVRQYTSLFENTFNDSESMLEAALIFLISLSIRMRLDRIDGIGETVWADEIIMRAVVSGFFKSLESYTAPAVFESDFAAHFKAYISAIDLEVLSNFSMMIAGSYHKGSSDYLIVKNNIEAHIIQFALEIKKASEL